MYAMVLQRCWLFKILPPSPKLNFTFGCTDFFNMSSCITWQLVFVRDQVVTKCFCKRCVVDPDLRKIFLQKSAIKIFESPPTPSPYTMLWATGVTKMRGTKRSKRPQHCIREGGKRTKKTKKSKNANQKLSFGEGWKMLTTTNIWDQFENPLPCEALHNRIGV